MCVINLIQKRCLIWAAISLLSMTSYSQEFMIKGGAYLHYDIFSITENQDNFKQRIDGLDPAFSISIAYFSNRNIIYHSGLYYSKFGHNIGVKDLYFPNTYRPKGQFLAFGAFC